jgi:hypothetical protein
MPATPAVRSPDSSATTEVTDVMVSIVARDLVSLDLGIAIASKALAVGGIAPDARADVGTISTQAMPNDADGLDDERLKASSLHTRQGAGAPIWDWRSSSGCWLTWRNPSRGRSRSMTSVMTAPRTMTSTTAVMRLRRRVRPAL